MKPDALYNYEAEGVHYNWYVFRFVILSLLSRHANFNRSAFCRCASAVAGYA